MTIPARPGGSSLGSCGSTNVPHKHAAAGVLAWAHVDELAEEVAGLRRRLRAEEEHARRLAEEVLLILRSLIAVLRTSVICGHLSISPARFGDVMMLSTVWAFAWSSSRGCDAK